MRGETLISILTINQVFDILQEYDGAPRLIGDNQIVSRTICHCGNKHKLIYYHEGKIMKCYTDCSKVYNIITLVQQIDGCNYGQAISKICGILGFKNEYNSDDFVIDRCDHNFIDKFNTKEDKNTLTPVDDSIMNSFYNYYYQGWIEEGIHPLVMKEFGIKYSIFHQAVIIPCRHVNGEMVGIRVRNLNQEVVDNGMKYMPLYANKVSYKHPTNLTLYGLWENLEEIKKHKKVIVFEAEKSVMMLKSFGLPSIGVATLGSKFSKEHMKLLFDIGVEEIVIGYDKEFYEINTPLEQAQVQKIKNIFIEKYSLFFQISVIHDRENLLEKSDSPTDKGKEVFLQLYKNKFNI